MAITTRGMDPYYRQEIEQEIRRREDCAYQEGLRQGSGRVQEWAAITSAPSTKPKESKESKEVNELLLLEDV